MQLSGMIDVLKEVESDDIKYSRLLEEFYLNKLEVRVIFLIHLSTH